MTNDEMKAEAEADPAPTALLTQEVQRLTRQCAELTAKLKEAEQARDNAKAHVQSEAHVAWIRGEAAIAAMKRADAAEARLTQVEQQLARIRALPRYYTEEDGKSTPKGMNCARCWIDVRDVIALFYPASDLEQAMKED